MEIFYSKYIFGTFPGQLGLLLFFFFFLLILLSQKLFKIIIQTSLNNHSFENFKDSLEKKKEFRNKISLQR